MCHGNGRFGIATEGKGQSVKFERLLVECADGLHLEGIVGGVVGGLWCGDGERVKVAHTVCRSGDLRRAGRFQTWRATIKARSHSGIAARISNFFRAGGVLRHRHAVVGGGVGEVEGVSVLLKLHELL